MNYLEPDKLKYLEEKLFPYLEASIESVTIYSLTKIKLLEYVKVHKLYEQEEEKDEFKD
jgi:hypothetical protein